MFVGVGGGVHVAAEDWAVEGLGELVDHLGCFGGLEKGGEGVPIFGFVWVASEVFVLEEVGVGEGEVDEDWPGFVLFGDGGEVGVEACGGVPGGGSCGVGVPGRPVALGDGGVVWGEVGELGLGEGFGGEEGVVGPDSGREEGDEEDGHDDEECFFHDWIVVVLVFRV